MSTCVHCGQNHIASLSICPKTGKLLGTGGPTSQKTLFGVAPSPASPPAAASQKPAAGEVPPPAPAAGAPPAPGKTRLGGSPPPLRAAPSARAARLPTAEEARDDPDLVISLDDAPPPRGSASLSDATKSSRSVPSGRPAGDVAKAAANVASPAGADHREEPRGARRDAEMGAQEVATSAAPDRPTSSQPATGNAPVDLPPAGSGGRFALPMPDEETAPRTLPEGSRTIRDAKVVIAMFRWAIGNYLRYPKQFFLLAAFVVLPPAILESCLLAGTAPADAAALAAVRPGVDFSARKAELAARIQDSQARGALDKQATAELAALTSVETALVPTAEMASRESDHGLRARLAAAIRGFLLLGLALPLALAVLALATIDQQGGLALPSFADAWPIIAARAELLLVSLLPAALLVALGHALYVVPGVLLSLLFVFLPHVVLFEKRAGRAALARAVELLRADARRAVLAFVVLGLAGSFPALLAHLLFPPTGSRAVIFVHFLLADLLALAVLPVPAMVLARLYLDIRARTGSVADRLARAARI